MGEDVYDTNIIAAICQAQCQACPLYIPPSTSQKNVSKQSVGERPKDKDAARPASQKQAYLSFSSRVAMVVVDAAVE